MRQQDKFQPNLPGQSAAVDLTRPEKFGQDTQRHLQTLQAGIDFQRDGKFPEAEFQYQLVLREDPDNAQALNLLGTLAVEADRFETSIELLEKAVKLERKNPVFRNNLANSYIISGMPEQAIPHLRRAISLNQRLLEPMINLARTYRTIGKSGDAIDWYRKVLGRNPEFPGAKHALGEALIEMGRMDEAMEILRECIISDQAPVPAAIALSSAYKFTPDDQTDIDLIEGLLERDDLDDDNIITLKYALGKIYNDLKRYDDAFASFEQAKVIAATEFSITEYRDYIDRLIAHFTPFFFLERKTLGDPSERPIFIVGMPRSGTTLTEQILSSHPQVKGAGELPDMGNIVDRISPNGRQSELFLENLAKMKDEASREVAQVYLAALNRHSRSALRVVDKMPHNFEVLGLIALLFPNAKIIYCKRDAMDNSVSCFMHHFSEFHGYNSDLGDLGLYYREHVRLMDHWKSVLPLEIYESRYEDLIADQETMSRRLIDFVGLEWDDACLQFHKQERSVKTFSRWQVRQPIYTSSIRRWKRYDQHLGPLKKSLGDLFEES